MIREEKFNNMVKNRNGITLITLTITIIIMIIIMGIIVSMELGKSNSSRILQYKYQLEEKINEDILSYDKEMNEKISNSSSKIYTYTEYLKRIIRKEIENMGLTNILNYNNMNIKLDNSNKNKENIEIEIPLKDKVEEMVSIELNIKNTYKVYDNNLEIQEEEYKGIKNITIN